MYKITYGEYTNKADALDELFNMENKGIQTARLIVVNNNYKILLAEEDTEEAAAETLAIIAGIGYNAKIE